MKNYTLIIVLGIIVNIAVSACAATPTPDIEATVKAAVVAALTALPTVTPEQTATPAETSSPTPLPLTYTPTSTPTATPASATSTPTQKPPTSTPTPAPPTLIPTSPPPTATPPPVILSAPVLLEPAESETAYAWFDGKQPTMFRWQWTGQLPSNSTFEVRIWLEGIDPTSFGAYDVREVAILPPAEVQKEKEKREVERIKSYLIADEGNGIYSIVFNTRAARSVRPDYRTYLWTVAVVQIDPYERIGLEAPPRPINIAYIDPTPTLVW